MVFSTTAQNMDDGTVLKGEVLSPPSQKAHARAERANKANLVNAIEKGSIKTLVAFADANFDAIEAFHTRHRMAQISTYFDKLLADLKSADAKKADYAKSHLRDTLATFVEHSGLDITDYDLGRMRIRTTSPEAEQAKIDNRTEQLEKARTSALKGFKSIGLGLLHASTLPFYAVSHPPVATLKRTFSAASNLSISPLANFWVAGANLIGWGPVTRHAMLAGATAIAGAALLMPISAAPHAELFTYGKITPASFLLACRDNPATMQSGRLTAAFAVGLETTNPVRKLHYISAMESTKFGISPVATYIVSMQETGGGRDVTALESTASGAYQTVTSTKLDQLKNFAQKTPYYLDAQRRLASSTPYEGRATDETFIGAIDVLVADYRRNPETVLQTIKDGKLNLAYQMAMNSTNDPVFSGQLMAADLAKNAPYLSSENLEGKSLAEVGAEIARYYRTHMLGKQGAEFFEYVLANAPDTKMNDNAALRALYKKHNRGAKPETVAYFANYLKVAASRNPAVFTNGVKTTAAQASAGFDRFSGQWSTPVLAKLEKTLARGTTGLEICANEPETIHAIVPETTNTLEIASLRAKIHLQEKAPQVLTYAREGQQLAATAFTIASNWYTATFPDKQSQNTTTQTDAIGALILESEATQTQTKARQGGPAARL